MSDHPPQPDRTLSEISHLFLSSVRERQTRGAARPQRRPPAHAPADASHADLSVDLTPEEVAQVIGGLDGIDGLEPQSATAAVPVSAVLASHLGSQQTARARQYAAHLARGGARVAMIEMSASELRLWCFEPTATPHNVEPVAPSVESLDPRRMTETLHELAHDVDHWLLVIPQPSGSESRAILRRIERWVLLAACDRDGIVAAYRKLKGLAESHQRNPDGRALPKLSIALLDAPQESDAARVFKKLADVAEQFLHWQVEYEPPVRAAGNVAAHLLLDCRGTHDKAQLAAAPQWQVVSDFLAHLKTVAREPAPTPAPTPQAHTDEPQAHTDEPHSAELPPPQPALRATAREYLAVNAAAESSAVDERAPHSDVAPVAPSNVAPHRLDAEVLELPAGPATPHSIAAAALRGSGDLVECPIRPPMCPDACLAVARDRRLVLLAVARQGLSDLRAIGQAYRWMVENRPLISMAVPQFAIDAHQLPRLHLLVDHADVSAEILQPMLQSGHVIVSAYRKLRWGGRSGLLLEAA